MSEAFQRSPGGVFVKSPANARNSVTQVVLPPLIGGCGLRAWNWETSYCVIRFSGLATADYQVSIDGTKRYYYRTSHLNGTWTLYWYSKPGVWQPTWPNPGLSYYLRVGEFIEPDSTFRTDQPYKLVIEAGCAFLSSGGWVFRIVGGTRSFPGVTVGFHCPFSASPAGQIFTKVEGDFVDTHDQPLGGILPGGSCEVLEFYPGNH